MMPQQKVRIGLDDHLYRWAEKQAQARGVSVDVFLSQIVNEEILVKAAKSADDPPFDSR
jgi:hypothetical protein